MQKQKKQKEFVGRCDLIYFWRENQKIKKQQIMKKFILTLAICLTTTGAFTQEQSAELAQMRNDGIAAYEAKDYQTAFEKFSAYLSQTNNQDSVVAYNCGICADKIKKPAEAEKYFDIAIQKNFNLANAYIGKASALKDQKKNNEYVATLKEGLEAVPGNKTLTRLYATFYVNQGVMAQRTKKMDEAQEAFKQALTIQPENVNALNALGSLYYAQGAAIVQTDMDKAKAEFAEAKIYLEKLLPLLSDTNAAQKKMKTNASTMLNYINSLQ